MNLAAREPPEQKRVNRPERKLALSAAARAPLTLSSSQAILVAEKYGSSSRPVFSVTAASRPAARNAAQASAVRRSCQTIALWIGLPVARSQTIVGLALVRDADAGDILGADASLRHRFPHGCDDGRPDVLGIVLDPSWRWIDLPQLLLRDGDRGELASNTIARVEVVP